MSTMSKFAEKKSPTLWATPVLLAGCAKIPVIYLHCPYSSTHFISFYVVLSLSDKPNYHIKLIIYIPLKYILLNFHYIHMFPKYFWLKSKCSHKRMDPLTEICHTADPSGVMKRRGCWNISHLLMCGQSINLHLVIVICHVKNYRRVSCRWRRAPMVLGVVLSQ